MYACTHVHFYMCTCDYTVQIQVQTQPWNYASVIRPTL